MKYLTNQNGFTYILALTIVMIMGIMLGMVGQSWKTIRQRELEEELIFRGDQVGEVIYQRMLCKKATLPPPLPGGLNFFWPVNSVNGTVLDDLVTNGITENCSGFNNTLFRLRPSAAIDPFTNSKWDFVTQNTPLPPIVSPLTTVTPLTQVTPVTPVSPVSPVTPVTGNDRFIGVKSASTIHPIMRNFSSVYAIRDLDNRQSYSDWYFTWNLNWKKRYP